jgi:hypothetical protein
VFTYEKRLFKRAGLQRLGQINKRLAVFVACSRKLDPAPFSQTFFHCPQARALHRNTFAPRISG